MNMVLDTNADSKLDDLDAVARLVRLLRASPEGTSAKDILKRAHRMFSDMSKSRVNQLLIQAVDNLLPRSKETLKPKRQHLRTRNYTGSST